MKKMDGHLVGFASAVDLDNADEVDFAQRIYDGKNFQYNDGRRWDLIRKKWEEQASASIQKMSKKVEEKLKTIKTRSEKVRILQNFYYFVTYMSALYNRPFLVSESILSKFEKMKEKGLLNGSKEYFNSSSDFFVKRLSLAQRKFKRQQLLRYLRDLAILRKLRNQQHLKHAQDLDAFGGDSLFSPEERALSVLDLPEEACREDLIQNRLGLIEKIRRELQEDFIRDMRAEELKGHMRARDLKGEKIPLKEFLSRQSQKSEKKY